MMLSIGPAEAGRQPTSARRQTRIRTRMGRPRRREVTNRSCDLASLLLGVAVEAAEAVGVGAAALGEAEDLGHVRRDLLLHELGDLGVLAGAQLGEVELGEVGVGHLVLLRDRPLAVAGL